MTNIPHEYIIAALLGLGGAAVFSLAGPMARGIYACGKFAFFCLGACIEMAAEDHESKTAACAFAWRCVYSEKKPKPVVSGETPAQLADKVTAIVAAYNKDAINRISYLERSLDARTERWDRTDGLACTRITALEERMDAVESKTDHLVVYNPNYQYRFGPNDPDPSLPCGDGHSVPYACTSHKTYKPFVWRGDGASSGKPCPKPTKDLRPGDEISVKAIVTNVSLDAITYRVASSPEFLGRCVDLHGDEQSLGLLRTDNK